MKTAFRLACMSGTAVAAIWTMIAVPVAAGADANVAAVTTPKSGKLTICRNWLIYNSCTTYGKVVLPERVAIGDKLDLTYGSNPKDYTFPVELIRQRGTTCTILSDATEAAEGGEKIEIAPCQSAANPATNPR